MMAFRKQSVLLLCGVLVVLVAGCAGKTGKFVQYLTGRVNLEQYKKDGVQYGVTKGRFRGRWWNYYERGCSFLDGGFYEEAERDFRAALQNRSRDQLWPRTYGLHFIPEYFSNRELGVALFQQGDVEGGLEHLERSLEQLYSARAAYYTDQARGAWLESTGGDVAAPAIEILGPRPEDWVNATQVELAGIARDDTYVAAILIDGRPYDVKLSEGEVRFSRMVALRPGQNEVEVSVTDLLGKTTVTTVPIRADVDGPVVSFDPPVVLPGVVSGVAFDTAGVRRMTIGGKDVAIVDEGSGLFSFAVAFERAELTAPVEYACEDRNTNVTAGRLPLDALLLESFTPGIRFAQWRPEIVALGRGLEAMVMDGRIMAVVAAAAQDTSALVDLTNLKEGQEYFQEEIVVAMTVQSDSPIEDLELNGEPVPIIPGRQSLNVTRRVPLKTGNNEVVARANDAAGRTGRAVRNVKRAVPETQVPGRRLAIAFLGHVTKDDNPKLYEEAEEVLDELPMTPGVHERFDVVDRDIIEEILTEQQLSAELGSTRDKLRVGRLIPAEMMLVAHVRGDEESIEIILEGTSTETGLRVLNRVEVAGTHDQLEQLIADLGVRLAQEVPRVKGKVIGWDDPTVVFDITEEQRILRHLKCLVCRQEEVNDPETGVFLGNRSVVICEGLITNVGRAFSEAEALPEEEGGDTASLGIEIGHLVVTK